MSPLVEGMIPAEMAIKHMVVGRRRRRGLSPGSDRQPARRWDDGGDQPGDGLEGEALPGDSRRHCHRAYSHLRADCRPDRALLIAPGVDPPPLHVNQILVKVVEARGSDLHLTAGRPPMARIDGELLPMEGFDVLTPSTVRDLIYEILSQKLRERFETNLELDTSHVVPTVGRFRFNVFQQRDSVGAVFRTIPFEILSLDKLGMPKSVRQFADLPRGLVLVTGPTGSGKSTTLAALIDIINTTKPLHIMSVEDPIEYLHHHKTAVVNQREVGEDTKSFSEALKHVLRQDPDVILVGEMRDLETIQTALTAAETGHLVFATLHTQDAPQSIDRMIDVFPAHQQQQVRTQLATTIQGIVTQQLLPRASGPGASWLAKSWWPRRRSATSSGRAKATRYTTRCRRGRSSACKAWTRHWPTL